MKLDQSLDPILPSLNGEISDINNDHMTSGKWGDISMETNDHIVTRTLAGAFLIVCIGYAAEKASEAWCRIKKLPKPENA